MKIDGLKGTLMHQQFNNNSAYKEYYELKDSYLLSYRSTRPKT